MTETNIVNGNKEECDVWIDRRSKFGNPFPISEAPDSFPKEVKRKYVIHLYRTWFEFKVENDEEFRKAVEKLRGKKLGCHCKPKPCHGDVIKTYLEGPQLSEEYQGMSGREVIEKRREKRSFSKQNEGEK